MPPPDGEPDAEAALRAEGRRMTDEIKKRISPQLEEMGVEGFLLIGYIRTGDGKRNRLMMVSAGDDPAIADGLEPVARAGAVWAGMIKPWRPDGG